MNIARVLVASDLNFENLKAALSVSRTNSLPKDGHIPSRLQPFSLAWDNELEGDDYTVLINFPRPFSRLQTRSPIIGPWFESAESQRAAIAFACLWWNVFDRLAEATARQSAKFSFDDLLWSNVRKRPCVKKRENHDDSRVARCSFVWRTKSTSPFPCPISCFISLSRGSSNLGEKLHSRCSSMDGPEIRSLCPLFWFNRGFSSCCVIFRRKDDISSNRVWKSIP